MLLAAMLAPLGSLRAADVAAAADDARDGLLLLRNGYVLQGRVSRVGQRYIVATATGEIEVPVEKADTFCLNLDEAYRFKRAGINPEGAEDRHALAAWCLRYNLTRQAADEISAAEQLRPNHPTTRRLQQRLQMALRPPPKPAAPVKADASRPSAAQLAKLIETLPPGTLESFTHYIQPLLLNRCVSCHGRPGAGTFRLWRLPRGRPRDHRITQANLFATLQHVDREKPEGSKLLALPLEPHGGSRKAVFDDKKQRQYRLLAGWVHVVARATASKTSTSNATVPKAVASKPKTLLQTRGPLLQVMDRSDEPLKQDQDAPAPTTKQPAVQQRPQHSAVGRFVPRDAFDPEIFNRRYFSQPADASPRRSRPNHNVKGDRRIEFGVGRRPSSRPKRPAESR